MANFVAADLVIAAVEVRLMGRKRRTTGTITFGGGPTYVTPGMPLPAIGNFGMYRQLDSLIVVGMTPLITNFLVSFSKAAHKLQLFQSTTGAPNILVEIADATVPDARTYIWEAWGW